MQVGRAARPLGPRTAHRQRQREHVERLFFYRRHHHDTTADQLASSLKASLSAALRLYFPLSGHLRLTSGTAARHDIFYQPGDGVAFTLAEYHHDGADLASDRRPRQVIELAKLVPRLRHTADAGAAILAVQATVLLPRGELALGVTVHHAACRARHINAAEVLRARRRPGPRLVLLPPSQTGGRCRSDSLLHTPRGPPEGDERAGGVPGQLPRPGQDLASAGAGGVFAACAAIAAGIEKAVATPEWETLLERVKEAGAAGVLSVVGSPRFRVYDVDFGFGPPAKVDILSVARTGAVALAESGRGAGIEVGMSFGPAGMEAFQRCFADAVAWLSPPPPSCGATA